MKQISIDWLYGNLKSHFEHDGDLLEAVIFSFEQAKAMHKQEIIQAARRGYFVAEDSIISFEDAKLYGDEYYNQTFKSE